MEALFSRISSLVCWLPVTPGKADGRYIDKVEEGVEIFMVGEPCKCE